MNCTQSGPQTDVSAPGVGTAAAKHHRDMMWLLRLHRPRPRDYRRTATDGATDFRAGSRLNQSADPPGTGVLGFASSVNGYLRALGPVGLVSARERLFLATQDSSLLTREHLSGNLVLTK
jgi:hypothetical protein